MHCLFISLLCLFFSLAAYSQSPYDAFFGRKGNAKARQHTQKLMLSLQDENLENAIKIISQKFGVSIATGVDNLPDRKVSLKEHAYSLEEVLKQILMDTTLEPVILSNGDVVIREKALKKRNKPGVVNGKVMDAQTGEPLTGVNILVKDQKIGTISDTNGEFYLTSAHTEEEINLLFSYIGYETQIKSVRFGESAPVKLQVQLHEDIARLNEVVVTGTSVATVKKQLGNSVSLLSYEDIQHSGALSIDAALAGKVSGAQIIQNSGEAAPGLSIRLRGISSVNGSSDPLVMVDGVIINNDSPELIALQGTAQNRLIDLNPNDIERIEIIKGAAAAAIYGSRANNGVVQIFTRRGEQTKPVLRFESKILYNDLRKKIPFNEVPLKWERTTENRNTSTLPAQRYDYQSLIFRPSLSTDQYLSLSGGTKETRYFASGSYLKNNGIIENAHFSRLGGRFRLDQMLNSWANLSIGGNYTHSKSQEVPGSRGFGVLSGFVFADNTIDPHADFSGTYPRTSVLANPLEVIEKYDFSQRVSRFIGDIHLNLTPANGLNIQYVLGYDTYRQAATGFIPGQNTSDFSTGYALNGNLNVGQINSDLTASYQHIFSEIFTSTSTLGFTGQYQRTESIRIEADQVNPLIQTTDGGSIRSRSDRKGEISIFGGYFQQNIGIARKLFLTGAARLDASSVFGRKERFQFYPKASVSYLLSEENFWGENLRKHIHLLKVRAAWGQSGNLTGIGAYDRFTNYNATPIGGQVGVVPDTRLGNETLRPERQIETELGLDVSLLDGRVSLEVTGYHKRVKDVLLFRELSPSSGFESRIENVGNLSNKGVELMVQAIPVKTNHFTWKTTAIYSQNRNKVDGIKGERVIYGERGFGIASAQNGYPLGVFYGNPYARDEQGNILLDGNGLPQRSRDANNALINTVIGDPNPDFTASFMNEISFKQWNFRMLWDAVQRMDVFNFNRRLMNNGTYGGGKEVGKELTGELPKGYGGAQFNILEEFVEDGSFVKLREISISYGFALKKWGIEGASVSMIGRNILSIDKYRGWDPEINYAGQSNVVRGFDFTTVPIPRTLQLSLSASF